MNSQNLTFQNGAVLVAHSNVLNFSDGGIGVARSQESTVNGNVGVLVAQTATVNEGQTGLIVAREIRGEKIIGIDIKRLSPYPERITDTDVIFDMMFHDLDLLQVLMPDEIIELKAKGEKIRSKLIDRAVATLTHKSGAISRVEASRVFGSRSRNITVTTEKYVIEADLLNKSIYIRDFSSPTPSTIPIKPNDQLTEELKDFIGAIKTKSRTTVTPEEILKTLTLAEEIKKLC